MCLSGFGGRERLENRILGKRIYFVGDRRLRREARVRGGWFSKSRNIGADRQFDYQFPGVIRVVIVLAEPFPNFGCRCANHRIQIDIVDGFAPKSLDANCPFLQFARIAKKRLLDSVGEQYRVSLTIREQRVRNEPPQLLANECWIRPKLHTVLSIHGM